MLDNDQYKFLMMQALFKLGFATVPVEYKFKCRTPGIRFDDSFEEIKNMIYSIDSFSFKKEEIDFMRQFRYYHNDYLSFLKRYKFEPREHIKLKLNKETGELQLRIIGGWYETILYEVPVLAIIEESFMKQNSYNASTNLIDEAKKRLKNKTSNLPEDFKFVDFGTRRRQSSLWHENVVRFCKELKNFIGTSNLYLAKKYNITPIGTQAHEWGMAHQQLGYRLSKSQAMSFENWIKVYRGDLGIALADVINTDAFLRDFNDPFLYKLFDGVREDSEKDPINFGHRIINFYSSKGIDPKLKTIVFSNALNFPKAIKIWEQLHNLIQCSFGIGTNLTNDFPQDHIDIVIKMVKCNNSPVAKISNAPGKTMCEDENFYKYLCNTYKIRV
jgi:nicotinate phosphoribosyltransferase